MSAWPKHITKTSRSPRGFFPRDCASTSTTFMRIAESLTILAMKWATRSTSLELLDTGKLNSMPAMRASPRHPVFVALQKTVRQCGIPQHEFSDLLNAFRQDQTVTRYETFDDLLGYCRIFGQSGGRIWFCISAGTR